MAKAATSKSGPPRAKTRRMSVGRARRHDWMSWRVVFTNSTYLTGALIACVAVLIISVLAIWSRERVLVQPGQVMTETRLHRVDFRIEDTQTTQLKREEARKAAPQVYELNNLYLTRLAGELSGLPKAVSGKTSIDDVSPELREEYKLTNAGLAALQPYAVDGRTTEQWKQRVDTLVNNVLLRNPLLSTDDYQTHWTAREYSPTLRRVVHREDEGDFKDLSGDAIELISDSSGELERRIERLVLQADFPPDVAPFITAKILADRKPTLTYDEQWTERLADEAAAQVETQYIQKNAGEVIYARGDRLDPKQYDDAQAEARAFYANASTWRIWSPRVAVFGLIALIAVLLSAFVVHFERRVLHNPLRALAIASTLIAMMIITVIVAPNLLHLSAVAPTLFATLVLLLAYDQRLAFVAALAQATFVTLALGAGLGWLLMIAVGCATTVAQLREVRNRNSLIRAGIVTAAAFGIGSILIGLLETPLVSGALGQIMTGAVWSMAGAFGIAFVVMGILPTIEKLFDITTGMTLAELRDPKQPLLRELQQKAPGTYNHSLQVANIAEAAAESIGADGLLVYVGALYHDVGKLNKPDYFVENQAAGYNKHEKLSPAMSLLVIVGHVKDGIELAREYNLPRSLIHFIESHHGTTLVEYFYHAARTRAEQHAKEDVEEVRFRYPGPKPQTKEAAILMLSDAVESATRAMKEPNPARIESLVRELSDKRLQDGQFDESDLTFRELTMIEDAIISRVCAIHHGRISYPSAKATDRPKEGPMPPTQSQVDAARSA